MSESQKLPHPPKRSELNLQEEIDLWDALKGPVYVRDPLEPFPDTSSIEERGATPTHPGEIWPIYVANEMDPPTVIWRDMTLPQRTN